MENKISTLHRGLLWLATLTGVLFGAAYYLAPELATKPLGISAPDLTAIRTIGGFLLGAAVGAWYALRSGQWSEVRIVTYYLITWNILNSLVMSVAIFLGLEPFWLLPNVIITAVVGLGLAFIVWQRRSS